jgi:hypothetical protein
MILCVSHCESLNETAGLGKGEQGREVAYKVLGNCMPHVHAVPFLVEPCLA